MKSKQILVTIGVAWVFGGIAPADLVSDTINAGSPVAYWRLGDTSGTVVAAESGSAGAYEGGPGLGSAGVAGAPVDTAVSFDGTDDMARILDATDPAGYTIALWVKPDVSPTGFRNLIYRTSSNEAGTFSHILQLVSGTTVRHYTFDGAARQVDATTPLVSGEWAHLVATYQPGGSGHMGVWVNGVEEGAFDGALNNAWAGGDRWILGRNHGGSPNFFDGAMDEVAVFDRVLSPGEIQAQYQAGLGVIPEPGTLVLSVLGLGCVLLVRRGRWLIA